METQALATDDAEKLLAAANGASGPARTAWLAFLALIAYLLITLAGVTHVDLLLNSPVTLPIVSVEIPLFSFFLTAPFLFLLVHLGLLVQHAMLAHKYQHFSAATADSEGGRTGEHPDRKLVHYYVFSQMLAGPRPPWPLHLLMRLMVFVTFSLLPILVLLYFQVKFLPSHDVATTHAHRIAILLDLALLFIVRPFVAMPYLRPQGRKLFLGDPSWRWEMSYTSLGLAGLLCLVIASFSLLVATIPHGCFWPYADQRYGEDGECFSLDRATARWWAVTVRSTTLSREVFAPTAWLFEGYVDQISGLSDSLFSRNLFLTDKNVIERPPSEEGKHSLQLRGRDLRFAVLDRSDLRYADLFGSDLRGASAVGARLDGARLEDALLQGADLSFAELQAANLYIAQLQEADLSNAQLQRADLRSAQLQGASLSEAQLQGANLYQAQLQRASLGKAQMQGASFLDAELQGARLIEAQLQGADLRSAQLGGAYLSSAQLQGASLFDAQLQGANLGAAQLQGANLGATRLQGANLNYANLQWASLLDANLQGATLENAVVWQTKPPQPADAKLAMAPGLKFEPLGVDQRRTLQTILSQAADESWREFPRARFELLLNTGEKPDWILSAEKEIWTDISRQAPPNPEELGHYLAGLSCVDGTGGHIIGSIAQRVLYFDFPTDRGYAKIFASRLLTESCAAAKQLGEETRVRLKRIAASGNGETLR